MTCFVSHTSVDSLDAFALSLWWKALLGYDDLADDPNEPGDEECMIVASETGHRILFIEVPEAKSGKNRLHFDVRPCERSRDEEVQHVLGLGATLVADHRGLHGPGSGWVVLADPEGNEFCILRSEAELATTDVSQ